MSGVTTTVNETGSNAFGEYLRARRETLVPEQLGLQRIGRRRVRGLRREEVAMAAAISTDYYMRLEQGRDRPAVRAGARRARAGAAARRR